MNQEDEYLTAKYTEYRQAFSKVERFTPLMPFGWFKSPQTIRLDGEFGLQQVAYRDFASDAARDLRIEARREKTRKCEASAQTPETRSGAEHGAVREYGRLVSGFGAVWVQG